MAEDGRKPQRLVLQLGAAFAVTTFVPITEITTNAVTPVERLSALREAAQAGCLELHCRTADGMLRPIARQRLAQGFERSIEAPFDKG